MVFDFKKLVTQNIKNTSGNTLTQTLAPQLNIKDAINLSTNSTTESYSDQRQYFKNITTTTNYSPIFALNSSGISGNPAISPAVSTTPTTTNKTEGGSAGINPNMVIIGAVACVAVIVGLPLIEKALKP
ncbi:hypothetical protein MsAg5_10330 [Methanosarcinaceae archaeon Ag5]|uniref:Uncharacterized protein n=1 Tax=Methanolapillus africanus TaxID=3028297 RepID=A0AAE4SD57_9EURY|nr:hypothetical protein [Methanosarcinaceae archaeon Ag5]